MSTILFMLIVNNDLIECKILTFKSFKHPQECVFYLFTSKLYVCYTHARMEGWIF
jgi:hypothetical protein